MYSRFTWQKTRKVVNFLPVSKYKFVDIVIQLLSSKFQVKECDKSQIIRENKVKYVHLEKRILAEFLNDHPFFVKLCSTFQDDASLCK